MCRQEGHCFVFSRVKSLGLSLRNYGEGETGEELPVYEREGENKEESKLRLDGVADVDVGRLLFTGRFGVEKSKPPG